MSRKLRVEEEKAKQLQLELEEEEKKLNREHERIFGPLVWRRFPNGIRIQDLHPKYYEKAIDIIVEDFLREDVVYRNTKIRDDPSSIKSFRDRILFGLKDHSSIIAIHQIEKEKSLDNENATTEDEVAAKNPKVPDEGDDEVEMVDHVAGILIFKAVKKCDYGRVFSRVMLSDGKCLQSVLDFVNFINRKVDIFEEFNCDVYLRYYLLCIRPDYRRKNLGYHLMSVGIDMARHLHIPVVMGLFNTYKLQKNAKKLGMQTLFEMTYGKWVDKSGELVFCDMGAGNYSCNLMAGPVAPPPPPEPIRKKEEPKPRTRAEKRAALMAN